MVKATNGGTSGLFFVLFELPFGGGYIKARGITDRCVAFVRLFKKYYNGLTLLRKAVCPVFVAPT